MFNKDDLGQYLDTIQTARGIDTEAMKRCKNFVQQLVTPDRLRLLLVEHLWAHPGTSVKDLMKFFNRDQPVISQELRFLRKAGLVDFHVKKKNGSIQSTRGAFHFYYVTIDAIDKIGIITELFAAKRTRTKNSVKAKSAEQAPTEGGE